MKNKHLTSSLAKKHLMKYSPYKASLGWVKWYSGVAPLKGKRTVQILLDYKAKKAKVLDLGCGTGLTLSVLAKTFPNSVGCEIGKREVAATKEILKAVGVSIPVILYDGYRLPFGNDSFDVVTSVEVYEHVDKPEVMLKEIKRVLKPHGILLISTANKLWPIEPHYHLPFLSLLPKRVAGFYLRALKRAKTYDDINLPTYENFLSCVSKNFRVKDITLDTIVDYCKYGLDKERGRLIIVLGRALGWFRRRHLSSWLEYLLVRMSLGWLFIAYPKK